MPLTPTSIPASAIGVTLYHAYFLLDTPTLVARAPSNAVSFTIVP
jgi:hypothetical protein